MNSRAMAQRSESFRVGAVLTLAGGFLDAYTYLCRGGVFANAQTGNMVLLGVRALEGNWSGALGYLVPILAFAAGVVAAEAVRSRAPLRGRLHWRQVTVAAELLILLAVAFLPQAWNMAANVAVSFVCAVQVESFRKLHGRAFATTMCTGNLRSGTEALWRFSQTGEREELRSAGRYYGIIAAFVLGAVLGALFTRLWGQWSALLCCLLLAAAFGMMFPGRGEARRDEAD